MRNRIPIPVDLIFSCKPHQPSEKFRPREFFPSKEDDASLRQEFKILVARDLMKYYEDMKWMKNFAPKYISHKYDEEVLRKSEIICKQKDINLRSDSMCERHVSN